MPSVSQYWPSNFWPDMNAALLWLFSRQSGPTGNWIANALYTDGATTLPETPAVTSGLIECGISSQTNFETGVTVSGAQGKTFPQQQIENITLLLPPGLYPDNQLGPDGYPINQSPLPLPWGSLLCNSYTVTAAMIAAVNYELYDPNNNSVTPGPPQTPQVVSKWQAGARYNFGQIIVDGNGNTEMALVSGVTCSSGVGNCSGNPPTWPTTVGALTGDNTEVWKLIALGFHNTGWLALGYCFNLLQPLSYYRVDVFAYSGSSFFYEGSSTLYRTALGGDALEQAGTFSVASVGAGLLIAALYPASVTEPSPGSSSATIPAGWVAHSNMGIGYKLAGYKAQVYVKTNIEYLQEDNIPILVQPDEYHARAGSSVVPISGTPTVHLLYDDPAAGWTEVYSSLQTLAQFQDLVRSWDVPPTDPLYVADASANAGATLENRCFIYDAALAILVYCGAGNFAAANRIIQQLNSFLNNPGYFPVNILENGEDNGSAGRWSKSNPSDSVTDVNDPAQPPYGTGFVVDFHALAANDYFTYTGPAQTGSGFTDSTDGQLSFQHKENAVGFIFDVSVTAAAGLVKHVQVTSGIAAPATLSGTTITIAVGAGTGAWRTELLNLESLISSVAGDALTSITGFKVTLTAAGDLYLDNFSLGDVQPANSLALSYDVYNGSIDQAEARAGAMAWVCYAYCVYMRTSLDFSPALYLQSMFNFLLTLESSASDSTKGLFYEGFGEYVNPGYQYVPGLQKTCLMQDQIILWFAFSRAALNLPVAAATLLKSSQITAAQAASLNTLAATLSAAAATIWTNVLAALYVAPGALPGHFAQGVSSAGVDTSQALDANSWGAMLADANSRDDVALQCLEFVYQTFLLANQEIFKSSVTNSYNETYQELTPFSGFKPYNDSAGGYSGSPLAAWQEGTWGVILALLQLYSIAGLAAYFVSEGTTIDAALSALIAGQDTVFTVTGNGLLGYSLAYRNLPYEFEVWPMLAPTAWMWLVSNNPSLLLTAIGQPALLPYLIIPNGQNQTVRDIDGASSVGQFTAESIDPGGALKQLAAQANLLGQVAQLKLGFPGQSVGDFVPMHTVQIIDVGFDNSGRVQIACGDLQRFFTGAVLWSNGGPGEWVPGGKPAFQPIGPSWLPNAFQCSTDNPRWLAGNPLDLYLAAMQNELGVGQDPALLPALGQAGNIEGLATSNPFWQKYVPGEPATLLNPNNYLDVPGILALRNGAFSGDWMEFKITSPVQAKSWLEEYVLKPLGLVTIVRNTGLLSLKSMKNAASQAPVVAFTQKNVMGIPQVSREAVINTLTARFDVNDALETTAARAYNNQVVYEQQTSIQQFKRIANAQVEATGLRTPYGAYLRSFLLADRTFRRYAFATPHYRVKAFLSTIIAEIGDYVSLTHPLVPDLQSGRVGINNVLCEVIGRQPNYAQGNITFDLYDTRFMKLTTPYQIVPASAGIPAWSQATAAERAQYFFISFLGAAAVAPSAITLVQQGSNYTSASNPTSLAVTCPKNFTAGNTLIVIFHTFDYGAGTFTLSDAGGDTFKAVGAPANLGDLSGTVYLLAFVAANIKAATGTVTMTIGSPSGLDGAVMEVLEYSGLSGVVDAYGADLNNAKTESLLTSQAGDLLIATGGVYDATTGASISSAGWNTLVTANYTSGYPQSVVTGSMIAGARGAYSVNFGGVSGISAYGFALIAFKQGGSAAVPAADYSTIF